MPNNEILRKPRAIAYRIWLRSRRLEVAATVAKPAWPETRKARRLNSSRRRATSQTLVQFALRPYGATAALSTKCLNAIALPQTARIPGSLSSQKIGEKSNLFENFAQFHLGHVKVRFLPEILR